MGLSSPQPSVARLRLGLHALVATLAVAVSARAVLLGERWAGYISLVIIAFVLVYLVRAVVQAVAVRHLLLTVLVTLWVVLALLRADAAYVSVGLFLIFLTEFSLGMALAGVITVTAVDACIGVAMGENTNALVAPVLGAALSVLIGLGFRVLFDATVAQRALIDQLHHARAELAVTERGLGQAEERQRLAREIHDTVAQGLSSIQMLLRAAEAEPLPEPAGKRVTLARETAGASLLEVRRVVAELAPADLIDATVGAALARVCKRAPVEVEFVVDGLPQRAAMPVAAALVRITQSALANVEQHAGKHARAVVTLSWSETSVRLDIVDDGVGFDVSVLDSPQHPSFGLDTVRTRAAQLGGEMVLESTPGHTALAVSFPLVNENAS